MTVANTILEQLGGNRFSCMTGAKNFVGGENMLMFSITKANGGINKVRITLNANDLYDVEFFKMGKFDYKVIAEQSDVYADSLRAVFTAHTNLYTSL